MTPSETAQESIKPSELASPEFLKKTEITDKAKELRETIKLPPFPGRNVQVEQGQAWLNLLTKDMFSILLMYVYRDKPIIDNTIVGADKNIEKIYGTEDGSIHAAMSDIYKYIKGTHGGGNYHLDVMDDSIRDENKRRIGTIKIMIPFNEAEPILNLRTLDVDNKDNKAYVTRLINDGKLDGRTKAVIDQNKNTNNSQETLGVVKEVLGFVDKLNQSQQDKIKKDIAGEGSVGKSLGEVLVEVTKQNDPTKMFTVMSTMMNSITSAMRDSNKSGGNDNAMLLKIMDNQTTMLTSVIMPMMMKMIDMNKPTPSTVNPSDPVDIFDKMLGAFERFKGISGNGNNEVDDRPKTGWDRAIDLVERVAEPLSMIIAQKMMTPGVPQAQQGMQGMPNMIMPNNVTPGYSPPPNTLPKQIPSASGPTTMAKPYNPYDPNRQQAPQQQAQQPPISQEQLIQIQQQQQQQQSNVVQMPPQKLSPEQDLAQAIMLYGGMMANSLQRGQTGTDFANWVIDGFGAEPLANIRNLTIPSIVNVMKNIPAFWQLVSNIDEGYIVQWVSDFKATINEAEQGMQGMEPATMMAVPEGDTAI